MSSAPSQASLPRILFLISHLQLIEQPSPMAREVMRLRPVHAGRASIEVADCAFDDILSFAQDAARYGRADIVICAGATGAFLQRHLALPVVRMKTGSEDLLYALDSARNADDAVAVASYKRAPPQLDSIRRLSSSDIGHGSYTTLAEARALVERFDRQGYGVVIGSSMVTQIARELGLRGVLAVSPAAIERALDDALATLHATQLETEKRLWLNATLRHLNHGVLAVDAAGIVQAINPALAKVLKVPVEGSAGRPLSEVAPQLDLRQLLAEDEADKPQVLQIGRETVLAHCHPMQEQGVTAGAVIVCQDAGSVQGADRQLRISSTRKDYRARYRLDQIIGSSAPLRSQIELAHRYARTDSTVLVRGESGTGKELFAQGIHNASPRASGPFVAINCASLPESLLESELFGYEEGAFSGARKGGKPGLFELAHTGTIFLDEIGDMPIALQTRLLRVLQEREVLRLGGTQPTPVDLRVIAATHRPLPTRIAEGQFRQDLYYRLNILRLQLPALRERRGDLRPLALHILDGILVRNRIDADATAIVDQLMDDLARHAWPGNVRELENVLERAALILGSAAFDFGPTHLRDILFDTVEAWPTAAGTQTDNDALRAAIRHHGGKLGATADALGISRTTLWRRLKAERLAGPDSPRPADDGDSDR